MKGTSVVLPGQHKNWGSKEERMGWVQSTGEVGAKAVIVKVGMKCWRGSSRMWQAGRSCRFSGKYFGCFG